MRLIPCSLPALAIAALLLFFGVTASAAERIGSIVRFSGQCTITRNDQKMDVDNDMPVQLNDEVATGLLSQLTVRFTDETLLSLDSLSSAVIDTYIYGGSDSNLLFGFSTGTFRTITGRIVELNPEGFTMQTPLATLGIRGSDIYALVGMVGEEAGGLDLGPNHTMEISTDTQTVTINKPGLRSTISPSGVISPPTPIPPRVFEQMKTLAPPPTPNVGTKIAPSPRVPPSSTATRSIVTPPPPTPAPAPRQPRFH